MGHVLKNGSHFEKWVTLGKMVHAWKSGSYFENGSQLAKWLRLKKQDPLRIMNN